MEIFSDLVPAEKHRILICCIMGLADDNGATYPNPLYKLGYRVKILEWDGVLNSDGEEVAPDLVLVDRENDHALVVECKSGKLEKDQLRRYSRVRREDIVNWGISSKNPRKLTHDITLISSYENGGRVLKSLSQSGWTFTFPTLRVNLVNIELIKNHFGRSELNAIFPVEINLLRPPQYLYPIGSDTPDHIIMTEIFTQLVKELFENESDVFEIELKNIILNLYPHWDGMGSRIKHYIINNVNRIILDLSKNRLLNKYIEYDNNKIKFAIPNYKNTNSLQAFQKAGTEYIDSLKRQPQRQTFIIDE